MKILSRIAKAVTIAVFVGSTAALMWSAFPPGTVGEGAVIFTIAFLAAIVAILAFIRRNEQNIEDAVRANDRDALRRMVFGKRRNKRQ